MESRKRPQRNVRPPARPGLDFDQTPEKEKKSPLSSKHDTSQATEKIRFNIAPTRAKNNLDPSSDDSAKGKDYSGSEFIGNISGNASNDQQLAQLSATSISSASTIPITSNAKSSQDDMFASQLDSGSMLGSSIPAGLSNLSESPQYEDFMKTSPERGTRNNKKTSVNSPSSLQSTKSSKTSTPKRRRPSPSSNDSCSNSAKLQRVSQDDCSISQSSTSSQLTMNIDMLTSRSGNVSTRRNKKDAVPVKSYTQNVAAKNSTVKLQANKKSAVRLGSFSQLADTQPVNPELLKMYPESRKSCTITYLSPALRRAGAPSGGLGAEEHPNYDSDDDLHLAFSQSQTQDNSIPSQSSSNGKSLSTTLGALDTIIESVDVDEHTKTRSMVNPNNLPLQKEMNVVSVESTPEVICITSDQSLPDVEVKNTTSSKEKLGAEIITIHDNDANSTSETIPTGLHTNGLNKNEECRSATFHITWVYERDMATKEVVPNSRRVYHCKELIPEATQSMHHFEVSSLSESALADVSGNSKNNSTGSVNSTEPFTLNMERISISTKTSSSSSGCLGLSNGTEIKIINKKHPSALPSRFNKANVEKVGKMACEGSIIVEALKAVESRGQFSTSNGQFASPLNVPRKKRPEKKPEIKVGLDQPQEDKCVLQDSALLARVVPENKSSESFQPNMYDDVPILAIDTSTPLVVTVTSMPLVEEPISIIQSTPREKTATHPEANNIQSIANVTPKSRSSKKRSARGKQSTKSRTVKKKLVSPVIESEEIIPENIPQRTVRRVLITSSKVAADDENLSRDFTQIQEPAFARWRDKRYYSAIVLNKTKDGHYNVKFDDGACKNLPEEFVIPVNGLNKGLKVFASNGQQYEHGEIVSFKVKDDIVHYVVRLDSAKEVAVPRSAICLTDEQARVLHEGRYTSLLGSPITGAVKRADVSLDNIVYNKRIRMQNFKSEELPSVSGTVLPRLSSMSDMSEAPPIVPDDFSGIETEYFEFDTHPNLTSDGQTKAAKKVKGRGNVEPAKSDNQKFIKSIGPIPTAGSTIFTGMKFFLTSNGRSCLTSQDSDSDGVVPLASEDSNSAGSPTDIEDLVDVCAQTPFVKVRIVNQIRAGGGMVFDSMDTLENFDDCYLISNGPCQTKKYILCLANNIPIINHVWVIHCCKANKKLETKGDVLPAGFSIEKKCIVELKDRQRRPPLKNMRVLVISDVEGFVSFWSQILETLGARVESSLADCDEKPSSDGVAVVVADHTFTAKLMAWSLFVGIPVVTSEWIKQCVINCERSNIHFEGYQYSPNV